MYTKEQIINSSKYRKYKDVLMVILDDKKTYTHEEIQKELDNFLTKEVKEQKN